MGEMIYISSHVENLIQLLIFVPEFTLRVAYRYKRIFVVFQIRLSSNVLYVNLVEFTSNM